MPIDDDGGDADAEVAGVDDRCRSFLWLQSGLTVKSKMESRRQIS